MFLELLGQHTSEAGNITRRELGLQPKYCGVHFRNPSRFVPS